jgi:N-acyl-D-aspartate/D-glutamate deacylase
MYDLIIKNGTVIDGTGAPAQHSDIAIFGGRVSQHLSVGSAEQHLRLLKKELQRHRT